MSPPAGAIAIATARFVTVLFGGLYAGFLLAVLFLEARCAARPRRSTSWCSR